MATPVSAIRVLVVEDEGSSSGEVRASFGPRFACEVVSSAEAGIQAFVEQPFDIVVSDAKLATATATGKMSGIDLLDSIHRQSPSTLFILMDDDAPVSKVIDAGKRGASDYLLRPFAADTLSLSLARAAAELDERPLATITLAASALRAGAIIGSSPAFAQTLAAVERVAHAMAPVLLVGESGTGKDMLAARIHALGPRRQRPFVTLHAGGPAAQLDREVFGQVAGVFGVAGQPRRGLVAEADGGTLFIDEIADLPLELQGKLLRVMEYGTVRAIGSEHERAVDVRFVAATQRDLGRAVREGAFRADLYFRLNALAIAVPPVRERREDLPALIDYLFTRACSKNPRSPVEKIGAETYERMLHATWAGNVREIQAFVEGLVVLGGERTAAAPTVDPPEANAVDPAELTLPLGELSTLREMTTRYVEAVLTHTTGDKARAAAILGIDVSTLYRWQRRRTSA